MNTPRQPALHDRVAMTHQEIEGQLPRQVVGHISRPILHLNPKQGAPVGLTDHAAVRVAGRARPEFPETGHSI